MGYAVIGGLLGKASAREDSYQHLRVFEDVVSLIVNNYVEDADLDKVMEGAMRGLAEGLDADSAWLTTDEVMQIEKKAPPPDGDVGVSLTRQYYLRVVAARDGSPAAKAGLMTGDFVRAIDRHPTRDMSVFEGQRAMRGDVGSKVTLTVLRGSAAEPRDVVLVREKLAAPTVTARTLDNQVGYVRVSAFDAGTADAVRARVNELKQAGADRLIVDVRGTSDGPIDAGLAAARLFVADGTLAQREERGKTKEPVRTPLVAGRGAGEIVLPTSILVTTGTSGAAELFTSALLGNSRADVVGERTLGRAAEQKLIRLPDGSGLWLTSARYLTPDGKPIHGAGVEPTLVVEEPDIEFGAPPPSSDVILDKALERLSAKKAA